MDKYALFFDIDGTLVSFETHQIPPSTILALTQAKANGHNQRSSLLHRRADGIMSCDTPRCRPVDCR